MLFAYLSQTPEGIKLRQQGGKQQALEHARERLERAVKGLKNKTASENEVVRQIYKQITPTFDPGDDGIWSEIDLLEGDPAHRGVAMRNPRHKPFWLRAEGRPCHFPETLPLWPTLPLPRDLATESGKVSRKRARLRSGTDPICCPMIASLPADTFTRSSDPQRRGRHTGSRHE
jgi:hypothetical protein